MRGASIIALCAFITITIASGSDYTRSEKKLIRRLKQQRHWPKAELLFETKYLDYEWPKGMTKEIATAKGDYILENNIISLPEIWGDRIFMTTPRWRPGVPSTLNYVKLGGDVHQKIRPFRGFKESTLGDCTKLQNVLGFDTDGEGKLWVLDAGRTNIATDTPDNRCPGKLVVYDLEQKGDPEVFRYVFPPEVATPNTTILDDLVLQRVGPKPDDWIAYITDIGVNDGCLIVYHRNKNESYRVDHPTMHPEPEAKTLTFQGKKYNVIVSGANGIAYDTRKDIVYYSALSGFKLYSVPGAVLRNRTKATNLVELDAHIQLRGYRTSQNGGMTMDNIGRLFLGVFNDDAIAEWNSDEILSPRTLKIVARDHLTMQFPDATKVYNCYLYFTTTRQHKYSSNTMDWTDYNIRIFRVPIGTNSYKEPGNLRCRNHNGRYDNKNYFDFDY